MANILGYLKTPFYASSGLAVLLGGLLYFKQNEIIYPRNMPPEARTNVPKPAQFGIRSAEELTIPTPDGESLNAFLIYAGNWQRKRNVTILMFHGNAGNIGHRLPIAKVLSEEIGCNVLMLQYRGYGLSTGDPFEKGISIDAQAGLDWILKHDRLKESKIVIYGQSLGGAVGVGLAVNNQPQIKGIILENTFLSIRKMIPAALPPARFLAPLCHEIWPTEEYILKIENIPFLFLSGLQDEIVPASQMKELYDLCRVKNKMWKGFPDGSHNNTVAEPEYFEYVEQFMQQYVDKQEE